MSSYISIANEFLFISFRLFYWFQKNIRISILSNMYFLVDWKQSQSLFLLILNTDNEFLYFHRQRILIYIFSFILLISKEYTNFNTFLYVFFSRLKVIAEFIFINFKYRQWVLIFPSPTNSYLYLFVYFIDFKRIYEFQYFQYVFFSRLKEIAEFNFY